VDEGPIIAQAAVPVLNGDSPESLAERVLAAEHRLYPMALALVAAGRVHVVDEKVVMAGPEAASQAVLISPPLALS
jgi:phosphoribosylglycinamide formyltransferase-1